MENIFSSSYILLSLFLSMLFLLLCYIIGQQFLEGQNYSFGLGQYHVTSAKDMSLAYCMEADNERMNANIFKSATLIRWFQHCFAQLCKGFYSVLFTLGCLIFVLIIHDINHSNDVLHSNVPLDKVDQFWWSFVMRSFTMAVTYALPFLLVFSATVKRLQVTSPRDHHQGQWLRGTALRLVPQVCSGLCVSVLAVFAEQLLLLGLGSSSPVVAMEMAAMGSREGVGGWSDFEGWIRRLQTILFFGMSEEGLRVSVAQVAVPGVVLAAFVAAYATVSLSFPVLSEAGLLLQRWQLGQRQMQKQGSLSASSTALQREVT